MAMRSATGTFEVSLRPAGTELEGDVHRFEFTKKFEGEIAGRSSGVMLSVGDPGAGSAGYVATETFYGTVRGRKGSFAMQQLGQMAPDGLRLIYEIVNGSGDGGLVGITGHVALTIDEDGTHHVEVSYNL